MRIMLRQMLSQRQLKVKSRLVAKMSGALTVFRIGNAFIQVKFNSCGFLCMPLRKHLKVRMYSKIGYEHNLQQMCNLIAQLCRCGYWWQMCTLSCIDQEIYQSIALFVV